MKRRRQFEEPPTTVFARGFLVTTLAELVASPRPDCAVLLRRALQGGAALTAGTAAATALARRDWTATLAAAAIGVVGVVALERLADACADDRCVTDEESHLGQA